MQTNPRSYQAQGISATRGQKCRSLGFGEWRKEDELSEGMVWGPLGRAGGGGGPGPAGRGPPQVKG